MVPVVPADAEHIAVELVQRRQELQAVSRDHPIAIDAYGVANRLEAILPTAHDDVQRTEAPRHKHHALALEHTDAWLPFMHEPCELHDDTPLASGNTAMALISIR
ncbi:hypothetical protein D3C80_1960240 [compost metagenome]